MEASDYLLIDQYLQGELPEEGQAAFQQRLETDPGFAAAFRERQQMQRYLQHQAKVPQLKAKMVALGAQHFKAEAKGATDSAEGKVVPLWRRTPIAIAAAAAAIALILLVWNPFQASGNLYEQYAAHQPLALQERNLDGLDSEAAEQAYNEGQYEAAYTRLSTLVEQKPDNPQLQLALGISALETDRVQEARMQFEALANGDTALQDFGRWYLALSFVKTGEYDRAKPLLRALTQQPSAFRPQAEALLQRL